VNIELALHLRNYSLYRVLYYAVTMANTGSMLTHDHVAQQSASLRTELKEWERAFAAANGGRKAGRDDIRKDEVMGMSTDSI
jgi:hypothetical protein